MKETPCLHCQEMSLRVPEIPALPLAFYGNPRGYHKPAPSKRYTTKLMGRDGNG